MKKNIFSLKYFFDNDKTDVVTIKWSQGLQEFWIYHKNDLITKIEGSLKLREGILIDFPKAGPIFIRLVQKPLGFEVKTGERYLFGSRKISEEKLVAISQIFTVVGVITILTNLNFAEIISIIDLLDYLPLLVGIFYIVAAIYIRKGYLSLYIIGLILFTISSLIIVLLLGWAGILFHVLRLVFLILIISHIKYINDLQRHKKALEQLDQSNREILDDFK